MSLFKIVSLPHKYQTIQKTPSIFDDTIHSLQEDDSNSSHLPQNTQNQGVFLVPSEVSEPPGLPTLNLIQLISSNTETNVSTISENIQKSVINHLENIYQDYNFTSMTCFPKPTEQYKSRTFILTGRLAQAKKPTLSINFSFLLIDNQHQSIPELLFEKSFPNIPNSMFFIKISPYSDELETQKIFHRWVSSAKLNRRHQLLRTASTEHYLKKARPPAFQKWRKFSQLIKTKLQRNLTYIASSHAKSMKLKTSFKKLRTHPLFKIQNSARQIALRNTSHAFYMKTALKKWKRFRQLNERSRNLNKQADIHHFKPQFKKLQNHQQNSAQKIILRNTSQKGMTLFYIKVALKKWTKLFEHTPTKQMQTKAVAFFEEHTQNRKKITTLNRWYLYSKTKQSIKQLTLEDIATISKEHLKKIEDLNLISELLGHILTVILGQLDDHKNIATATTHLFKLNKHFCLTIHKKLIDQLNDGQLTAYAKILNNLITSTSHKDLVLLINIFFDRLFICKIDKKNYDDTLPSDLVLFLIDQFENLSENSQYIAANIIMRFYLSSSYGPTLKEKISDKIIHKFFTLEENTMYDIVLLNPQFFSESIPKLIKFEKDILFKILLEINNIDPHLLLSMQFSKDFLSYLLTLLKNRKHPPETKQLIETLIFQHPFDDIKWDYIFNHYKCITKVDDRMKDFILSMDLEIDQNCTDLFKLIQKLVNEKLIDHPLTQLLFELIKQFIQRYTLDPHKKNSQFCLTHLIQFFINNLINSKDDDIKFFIKLISPILEITIGCISLALENTDKKNSLKFIKAMTLCYDELITSKDYQLALKTALVFKINLLQQSQKMRSIWTLALKANAEVSTFESILRNYTLYGLSLEKLYLLANKVVSYYRGDVLAALMEFKNLHELILTNKKGNLKESTVFHIIHIDETDISEENQKQLNHMLTLVLNHITEDEFATLFSASNLGKAYTPFHAAKNKPKMFEVLLTCKHYTRNQHSADSMKTNPEKYWTYVELVNILNEIHEKVIIPPPWLDSFIIAFNLGQITLSFYSNTDRRIAYPYLPEHIQDRKFPEESLLLMAIIVGLRNKPQLLKHVEKLSKKNSISTKKHMDILVFFLCFAANIQPNFFHDDCWEFIQPNVFKTFIKEHCTINLDELKRLLDTHPLCTKIPDGEDPIKTEQSHKEKILALCEEINNQKASEKTIIPMDTSILYVGLLTLSIIPLGLYLWSRRR